VRTAPHLPHQALLLNFAAELAQRLLELLLVLDDDLQPWITSFRWFSFPDDRPRFGTWILPKPGESIPQGIPV
jgi:hypothetical protein